MLGGRPVPRLALRRVTSDGREVSLSVSLVPVAGDEGPSGIIAVAEDVTERERALAELAEYRTHLEDLVEARTRELTEVNEELKRAMTTKTRFLASMSHELRTPLNSIVGFSSVLLEGTAGGLNGEQSRQVGLVHEAGRRLMGLVDEILDMSRLEAGKVEVSCATFGLRDTVRYVEALIAPQAAERGLAFEVGLPDEDALLATDREKVQAILTNLLGNAVKFTDEGRVTLETSVGGGTVTFEVRDTGIGIDPADLPHVFDEFHRAPRSVRRTVGSGLGLAIARGYAELLGGSIDAESTPGSGSTFRVVLPMTYASESGAA